ncbi:MFS transporter [Streptomyces sp. IMTB 2501]|uniref:MFS transporter n=1 Tax=Streptomyces sp. IMTB 2501 TaxID=1776340 RepID=UPI00353234B8
MPGDRRPFAAVLAANVVSITGNALTGMGVPWFVLQSTGSAAKAGVVAFCTMLPVVLSAMVGGPVIDLIGRRRVGIASDLLCGATVAAVPLLQFAGVLCFWMLCGLMAVTGLFHAPGDSARGVLLPTLAERSGMPLTRAAGLYDGAARCAGMIGSAVGGVLIAFLGAENILLLDAGTFAVSASLLAFGLRGLAEAQPQLRAKSATPHIYRRELSEGYRCVLRTPLLLSVCLMTLATRGLDQGWSAVLLPVHARDELGGPAGLGVLEALFSAGALTGALVYGAVASRFRRWPVFTIAFLIVGMPRFAVAAFTDTLPPLSATTASVLTITPLGGLAAGFFVDSVGLFTTMLTVGGVYLLVTLSPVIFPVWRQMDAPSSSRPGAKCPTPRGSGPELGAAGQDQIT